MFSVCLDDTFGSDCSLTCDDCSNGGKCNLWKNGCDCPDGWTGIICNQSEDWAHKQTLTLLTHTVTGQAAQPWQKARCTQMLIKRLLCVVNMINGVNECMGEEMVYAKKIQPHTKEPTKLRRVSYSNWALRAFIEHWHAGPRCCQCHWWETSHTNPAMSADETCHTHRPKGRQGRVGHHNKNTRGNLSTLTV